MRGGKKQIFNSQQLTSEAVSTLPTIFPIKALIFIILPKNFLIEHHTNHSSQTYH